MGYSKESVQRHVLPTWVWKQGSSAGQLAQLARMYLSSAQLMHSAFVIALNTIVWSDKVRQIYSLANIGVSLCQIAEYLDEKYCLCRSALPR